MLPETVVPDTTVFMVVGEVPYRILGTVLLPLGLIIKLIEVAEFEVLVAVFALNVGGVPGEVVKFLMVELELPFEELTKT